MGGKIIFNKYRILCAWENENKNYWTIGKLWLLKWNERFFAIERKLFDFQKGF